MGHEPATYSAVWAVVNAVCTLPSSLVIFDDAAFFLTCDDRTLLACVAAFIFDRSCESCTHICLLGVSNKSHKGTGLTDH